MTTTIEKTPNIAEPSTFCGYCGNTGWVELAGEVTALGTTYSRGMTACKWCEEGERRYLRAIRPPRDKHDGHRRWFPVSDFAEGDVIAVGYPDGEKPVKPAGDLVPQLPGMEEQPRIDQEAACRATYAVWRRWLGKPIADARLRERHGPDGEKLDRPVYPLDVVELVIAEADALEIPAEPAPDAEEEI